MGFFSYSPDLILHVYIRYIERYIICHELYISLQTLLDCLFAGLVGTVGCYMWEYAIKNTKSKQKKIIVRIQNSWGSASIFFKWQENWKKKIKMVTAEPWGGGPTHSCQIYLNESCFHANRSDGKRQIQYAWQESDHQDAFVGNKTESADKRTMLIPRCQKRCRSWKTNYKCSLRISTQNIAQLLDLIR